MTALQTLLTGPLGQAIGWALLHLLWQGVLVAAILAAALALLQRQTANARYLASCGALLLLVALGVATAYRSYSRQDLIPATVASAAVAEEASPAIAAEDASATAPDVVAAPPAPIWTRAALFASGHLTEVVMVWIAGVLLLSARLLVGWLRVHRLTTRGTNAPSSEWEASLARIAGALHLRRSIKLLQSAAVEVPTVIGWMRPVVLLPVAALSGLSVPQIEMILAHELAHIRRHDFIVNLLQSVVETLLFYHPAVWWISRRIRVEREHCCDDLAVAVFGDPLQYARALTRFEELRLDAAQSMVAANGGSLFDRIRRLVSAGAESANWSSRWAAGAALITVLGAVLVAPALPLFAERDQQPAPAAPPAPPAVTSTCPPKTKCDKLKKQIADSEVNVTAGDPAGDENADESDDPPQPAPSPAPTPMVSVMPAPIVTPHIAPMIQMAPIGGIVEGVIAPQEMETPTPERHRRRRIGEGGKLSVDDLITLRSAGVDPKYINEIRGAGLGDLSLDDIVSLRVQGVTPEYLRGLREAGVEIKSAETAVELRAQGVSPKYIQEMGSIGYKNLSVRDLVSLRAMGVTTAFVKSLADAGYPNLSVKELVRLRASGVDADFIRELSKYRTR